MILSMRWTALLLIYPHTTLYQPKRSSTLWLLPISLIYRYIGFYCPIPQIISYIRGIIGWIGINFSRPAPWPAAYLF